MFLSSSTVRLAFLFNFCLFKSHVVLSKDDVFVVPSLSLSNLKGVADGHNNHAARQMLAEALTTNGIVAITFDEDSKNGKIAPLSFSEARHNALQGLCNCIAPEESLFSESNDFHVNKILSSIDNSDFSILNDGVTTRTSIATATAVNDISLPLPTSQIDAVCGDTSHHDSIGESMEILRDYVHHISQEFIKSLDRLIVTSYPRNSRGHDFIMRSTKGNLYPSIESIVRGANNLEHFHVYSKKRQESDGSSSDRLYEVEKERATAALSSHVDAGLFLSFVPAVSCQNVATKANADKMHNSNDDASFMISSVDGRLQKAIFPQGGTNSIVIMLGTGAQNWLQNMPKSLNLRATKHSVKMAHGSARGWYGIMYLVPENAIIHESPHHNASFADMRRSMATSRHVNDRTFSDSNPQQASEGITEQSVVIGCGFDEQEVEDINVGESVDILSSYIPQRNYERRLQMVPDGSYCNNSTNFYCWMSCLDIPDAENSGLHLNNGESLYCADYTEEKQDIAKAVQSCEDRNGIPGAEMNTDCMGVWRITSEGVPSQKVDFGQNNETEQTAFCHGGTSMFMNGFQWNSLTCVVYLFPSWVLNTHWKLIVASIGTFFFGVALEGIIQGRRVILQRFRNKGMQRLSISTLFYGVQLSMGYLIMLVVMTYSGQLFLSTILGLMAGHFFFHWLCRDRDQDNMFSEGATPCCQNRLTTPDNRVEQNHLVSDHVGVASIEVQNKSNNEHTDRDMSTSCCSSDEKSSQSNLEDTGAIGECCCETAVIAEDELVGDSSHVDVVGHPAAATSYIGDSPKKPQAKEGEMEECCCCEDVSV